MYYHYVKCSENKGLEQRLFCEQVNYLKDKVARMTIAHIFVEGDWIR